MTSSHSSSPPGGPAARVQQLVLGDAPALPLLSGAVALRMSDVITEQERALHLSGVFRGRGDWTSNFDGLQFTLGRAWYTHLEQDLADQYFEHVAESDALVERFCPGLQDRMVELVGRVLGPGAEARRREGYCGAGVHVFPANGYCASTGGDIHFDTEGLTRSQLRERKRSLSFILMLQPPRRGGGLRVWTARWDGSDDVTPAMLETPRATAEYAPRDLVVIDGYSLHQIQPFEGDLDRVSATVHALEARPGVWDVWF